MKHLPMARALTIGRPYALGTILLASLYKSIGKYLSELPYQRVGGALLSHPYPRLGEERGRGMELRLFNLFFRHWWAHFIYIYIRK